MSPEDLELVFQRLNELEERVDELEALMELEIIEIPAPDKQSN